MINIYQKGEKILNRVTKEVALKDISSKKIKKVIEDMRNAMNSEEEAVAIAANQIGEPLRIFMVSGKVFLSEDKLKNIENLEKEEIPEDKVFINPEIIKVSKKREFVEEGCLSVRNMYGFVSRSAKASVRAYDENGKLFTLGGSGLLAQIFQHEIDHLNGILFTEKAKDLQEIKNNGTSKL